MTLLIVSAALMAWLAIGVACVSLCRAAARADAAAHDRAREVRRHLAALPRRYG